MVAELFANSGTSRMSSGREDDSSFYPLTPQRRNPVLIGNPPHSDVHWSSESHQESYVPMGLVPDAGHWQGLAVSSGFPSPYEGIRGNDQSLDEPYLGSSFGVPGGDVDVSENSFFMGMGVPSPISDNVVPEMGLPMFQTYPPPLAWTPWDTTFSWNRPVQPSEQFSDSSGAASLATQQPAAPPFQMTVSSVTSGPSGPTTVPTSSPITVPSNPVLSPDRWDPVVQVPFYAQSPGSDSSGTTTFQCLWRNRTRGTRCTALIAGDRKSISSHLRDAHDFLCDGQKVECAWDGCRSSMQRRNIPRHILASHFEIKVECPRCGLLLSRPDAKKKHLQACTGASMSTAMWASEEEEGGY